MEGLASELDSVRRTPESDEAWDHLEKAAGDLDKPDVVVALYEEILRGELTPGAALRLGERAVRFHEEWQGDDPTGLVRILDRVLELEPTSAWAFERLAVTLTVAGRWDELFAHYDRVIAEASRPEKLKLLGEAAQVARDVAGKPDRAIHYLLALQKLSPGDAQLAESTERMLERNERWPDLVRFWQERVEQLPPSEGQRLREKVARVFVERLEEPAEALTQLRRLLSETDDDREACRLLELILARTSWPATVRRGALDLLRSRYELAARPGEVVRILRVALGFVDSGEIGALHREIARLLAAAGDAAGAMDHYATVLAIDPHAGDARAELRRLAGLANAHGRRADALVAAADGCRDPLRVALLLEAARTRAEILADGPAAIELYRRVLGDADSDPTALLEAAGRLNELFDAVGRGPERLAILERLAEIEPLASDRRSALGQAATLAQTLGDPTHAIALWERRLEADPRDHEALSGLLAVLESDRRWADLVAGLRRRVALGGSAHQQRADLVRIATLQAGELGRRDEAIATWQEVRLAHGEDAESTDALAALLEAEGRWPELAALLEGATAREGARWIEAGVRLGDLYRERLGDPARASVAYDRTLKAAPGHAAARAGLIALVDDRLERASDAGGRATTLEDQARMEEETGALDAARRSLGRALVLVPDRVRLDAELERLAAATDAWAEAAQVFDEAAAAAKQATRAAELRAHAGAIHETRLGEPLRAAEAYAAAVVAAGRPPHAEALLRAARAVTPPAAVAAAVEAAAQALEQRGGGDELVQLLVLLADLQRPAGGQPLATTLARLAARRPADLALLREIAELARTLTPGDGSLPALERLFAESSRVLPGPGGEHALWALEALLALHTAAGRKARIVDLLLEGSRLAFDTATTQSLRRRAGAAALDAGDERRAAELYRHALERDPHDLGALRALIPLVNRDDQLPELLLLRRRELVLTEDAGERLTLRLEIARLAGILEERSDRVEMLVANLDEKPGHDSSIEALCDLLAARAAHERLADILASQAGRLEKASDGVRAARLWERIAHLAEAKLEDRERALEAYRKAASHDPTTASLDALARLHTGRGEHAAAATWLERRLAHPGGPPDRSELVLRLARAYLDARQPQRAMAALEAGLAAAPHAQKILDLLLQVYRAEGAWEALGHRLVEVCRGVDDPKLLLGYAAEVSEIFAVRLGTPALAIPVLERAVQLVPDDRALKTSLAEGLGAAGRWPEARALFDELIAGFGRRRSPERAEVHRKLAAVARANGDVETAIEQLDLAAKLDVSRPGLLGQLAAVARDAGRLEQAEQAYRGLLVLVRRRGGDDPETPVAAEVLHELSRIAAARGDEVQARELVESAIESAVQHPAEARRLERHLLARGETELLLRVTDTCLKSAELPVEKGEILATRARALASLGRNDEALAAWLAAIREAPNTSSVVQGAHAFAVAAGLLPGYLAGVSAIVDGRRRKEDWAQQAELVLQLAGLVEEEGDLRRAADLYQQLADHGERVVEALAAVVRLAGKLGDAQLQGEALEKLAGLSGAASADLKADALYRVAELQLGRADTQSAGLETLSRALELEPRHDVAADLMGVADAAQALDDAAFARYETLAGQSGNAHTLLTFFERRARRPEATLTQDREAVSLALRLDEAARAEALLAGAVARAREEVGGLAGATWALDALLERRIAASDWPQAEAWLRELAQVGEPTRVRALGLGLAAAASATDPTTAAAAYQLLLEHDPADREAWEPLLALYQRLGDTAAAQQLSQRLISSLVDPADRNRVRMSFVDYLVGHDQIDEAITTLNDVLFENPDHVEATSRLADLLERTGRGDELTELLGRQLDDARERGARELVVALSLRIGERLGTGAHEEAAALYRRGLEVAPGDPALLAALVACVDPARDGARARAEVLEQLLAVADAASAPAVALEVAELRTGLGEPAEAERALVAGRKAAPAHAGLRERLERHYREEESHADLAAFLESVAADADPARAVAMLCEAAEIQRDLLLEVNKAAGCLAQARRLAPSDGALLQDYLSTLMLAGQRDTAIAELAQALADGSWPRDVQAGLRRQRAELARAAGDLDAAIGDLEAAHAILGDEVVPELVTVLELRLRALEEGFDRDAERAMFARLVAVLESAGQHDRLRHVLETWVAGHADDLEAQRKLFAIETRAERWDGVVRVGSQLLGLERGEARAAVALAVADAAERAGNPAAGLPALLDLRRAGDRRVLERLERLYLATGAHAELADLLREEAASAGDPASAAAILVRVGQLHLERTGDNAGAVIALRQATELQPDSVDIAVLLADALTRAGHLAAAAEVLEPLLVEAKKKRSPRLPQLLRQLAYLAAASGDADGQIAWLQDAFDADRKNGHAAAELADAASRAGKFDIALKVLRHISLMDDPTPLTRGTALLQQARIALHLGNPGQAELWTKKALREDANLVEAQEFLAQLKAMKKPE